MMSRTMTMMKRVFLLTIWIELLQWNGVSAFVVRSPPLQQVSFLLPTHLKNAMALPTTTTTTTTTTRLLLASDKKKSGLDESIRNKLVSESIAPWRTLRLFFYGALGSGALVSGIITLSSLAAALSQGGAREDVDLSALYINLAINFGGIVFFAFLAKFDLDKKAELDDKVQERQEKKKEQRKVAEGMRERERTLGTLKLDIQVSEDGSTKEALVSELQAGARQHLIIVAGPKKACRDALVGANLNKMDFALKNVLVVPYQTDYDPTDELTRPSGSGFGDGQQQQQRPMYETQSYVARPAGDVDEWSEYIKAEMSDAVKQNGEKAKEEGIAIVVANTGRVLRRGVGKVPWRQMVEELERLESK